MTLKIIPLGGLGEIGLNMMVFEYGSTLFVVDAGIMFPEDYMLGVDYVIPDMSYLKQRGSRISGVVLTHVPVPPRDFPLKAGCTYFSVDTHGETWETIKESRAIAIYLGGPGLRESKFELIAMK